MTAKAMSEAMYAVADFHRAHQIPTPQYPTIPPDERVRLRARLLVEELGETLAAMFDTQHSTTAWPKRDDSIDETIDLLQSLIDDKPVRVDLVGLADGLADLQYVTIGAALEFGIPHARTFAEVCRSNATKVGGAKRADGKIEKPATYSPPDIRAILFPPEPPRPAMIDGWAFLDLTPRPSTVDERAARVMARPRGEK